jgi:Mlc titration factor MtfA (ptsG expression regulator)
LSAALAFAVAGCIAVLAWLVGRPLLAARRRARAAARGLSAEQKTRLLRAWPGYARVPSALKPRLDALTAVFLDDKEFVACGGLALTGSMRLAIAAQACLLVLGQDRRPYESLRAVLVYPSQFIVPDRWHDEDGVVTEEELVLSGQAWDVSRILLSWEDVAQSGHRDGADNVVIHEFAHYLDLEDGQSDGVPPLPSAAARERWSRILRAEFERVQDEVERGADPFLDEYAAHDEAEFFAVASEAFFEQPREFATRMPAMYAELRGFYRLDPAAW